jgi:hypothetical protein
MQRISQCLENSCEIQKHGGPLHRFSGSASPNSSGALTKSTFQKRGHAVVRHTVLNKKTDTPAMFKPIRDPFMNSPIRAGALSDDR